MADPRRATFLLFAALALSAALPRGAAEGQTLTSSTPARTQTLNVTVTDKKGNFVKGLKAEDFGVFEGKLRHPLVAFSGEEAPASLGILLDASGSMRGERMRIVCEALAGFLAAGHPSNEYFLIAFNNMPQMLVEPSADRAVIAGALGRLAATEQRGLTALYDAVYLGIDKAAHAGRGRRVLLVVSDGQDNSSQYTLNEVRRALAESDVTVYAVHLGGGDLTSELNVAGQAVLEEFARATGGRVYRPGSVKELKAALADLADELRSQYTLGFVPVPTTRQDGWHDVKVKVPDLRDEKNKHVKLVARTRPGFYEAAAPRR